MLLAPRDYKKEERFYSIALCVLFGVIVLVFMPRVLPRHLETITGCCCLQNLPIYDPVDDVTDGKCDYIVPWE